MAVTRKKLFLSFTLLILLYSFWLSFHLVRFNPHQDSGDSSPPFEITGAYHIHSTFSDGKKSVHKIAESAAESSLDFCILTDHGNPNYQSLNSQGWEKGVLILAGSELSVNRGHLVGLNFDDPQQRFPQKAESAAYQIKRLNGFSIIAHPYSKTHWTWGPYAGYSGIEIINADAMLKKNFLHMFPYLPALLIEPELPLLRMIKRPEKNLQKWDQLNDVFTTYGYYSTDAHMFYSPLFSLLKIHLILKEDLSSDFEKAKAQVFESLQNGCFYNSIDAAASASGFRFWGEKGDDIIYMGEKSLGDELISLHVKIPDSLSCQTVLIHNGKPALTDSKNSITYMCSNPGVYRVEVFLLEKSPLDPSCPWILSNPIFIKEEKHGQNR